MIDTFEAVSLEDITKVSLMKRMDTKYLLPRRDLEKFLYELQEFYYVVTIENERQLPYRTIYFDTPNLQFYTNHHNGHLNRVKYRSREYEQSHTVFNEIKIKKNNGFTTKKRVQRSTLHEHFDEVFTRFSDDMGHSVTEELLPQLLVTYDRITLVDKNYTERVTIDLNLLCSHNDRHTQFEDVVIIELKREKGSKKSPIQQTLKKFRSFPIGFSKYCMGVAMTHKNVKRNNFNEKLRKVARICA